MDDKGFKISDWIKVQKKITLKPRLWYVQSTINGVGVMNSRSSHRLILSFLTASSYRHYHYLPLCDPELFTTRVKSSSNYLVPKDNKIGYVHALTGGVVRKDFLHVPDPGYHYKKGLTIVPMAWAHERAMGVIGTVFKKRLFYCRQSVGDVLPYTTLTTNSDGEYSFNLFSRLI
jgi:hypothetical protein